MPGAVLLNWLLPGPINCGVSSSLDPVSRWSPAQGGRVAPGRRRRRPCPWWLVCWPEAPVQRLSLGSVAEVVPGVVVDCVGGGGGLGGGVVGAGWVGVRRHRPVGWNRSQVTDYDTVYCHFLPLIIAVVLTAFIELCILKLMKNHPNNPLKI